MDAPTPQVDAQALASHVDRFVAEFVGVNPNFRPMCLVVPEEWRDGFMYMYSQTCQIPLAIGVTEYRELFFYKHGITRKYLNVDAEGRCYHWTGKTYLPIPAAEALEAAFKGLEDMGWTRETAYSDEFIAARNEALARAGYTLLSSSPQGTEITNPVG